MNFIIQLGFEDLKMIRLGDVNYCEYDNKKLIISNGLKKIVIKYDNNIWKHNNSILKYIKINGNNLDIENILIYIFDNLYNNSWL